MTLFETIVSILSLAGFFFSMWKAGQWFAKLLFEKDDQ